MNQNVLKTVICLFIVIACSLNLNAQITIGSVIKPAKAALLELKSEQSDTDNITSTQGGLLLPRVQLQNKNTLQPFIAKDTDWDSNTGKVKEKHAGLVVYNLSSTMDATSADERFSPGIYVWDGTQWQQPVNSDKLARWFYPPAFNLPLESVATGQTYDLYAEYKRQFTKNTTDNPTFVDTQNQITTSVPSPIDGQLYKANEIDYVITWYDKSIIDNISINNNGVMTYDVLDNDPGALPFMNLVFVVKQ